MIDFKEIPADTIRSGESVYNDKAFNRAKHFIGAMAQRVFREMTELERERFTELQKLP